MRVIRMCATLSALACLLLPACAAPASPSDAKPSAPATAPTVTTKPNASPTPQAVSTKEAAQTESAGNRLDACTVLTANDAEDLLGAKVKNTYHLAPGTSKSYETRCSYRTESAPDRGFGLYVQVGEKPASAETAFETRVSMATEKSEPVPGLGDKAAYALEGVQGAGRAGAIYVLRGSVFFWITPTFGELTKEDAVKIAETVLGRLP